MPQLKTGLWIDALMRRAQANGAFACLLERGDRDAGSVLVVVRHDAGLSLYAPERDMSGERVWRCEILDAANLEKRLASRRDFDPDLNVVEIEDRKGRHFIDETVMDVPSDRPDEADAVAAARALFRDR